MKPRIIIVITATLSLVMLLSLSGSWGQSPVLAQEPEHPSQVSAPAGAGAMEEIVAMRARHRKVFRYNETPRLVDGQEVERRTMQVSLASLHYPDAAGQWQNVDTRPVDTGRQYRVDTTNAPVGLPKVGADPLVIQAGKDAISVRLVGASGAQASLAATPGTPGTTEAQRVAFANLLPQTDIAYQAEPDGLREFITLKGPGHPTVFTFEVATALKMSLAEGNIVFRDAAGEAVGQFTRPWVTMPGSPPVTRWGALSLDGARVTMTLPDLSGLTYPIVVDPTYGTYSASVMDGANDGFAKSSPQDWNSGDVRVNFGRGYMGESYNTALRWDNTSVPEATAITSAYVKFRSDGNHGNNSLLVSIKAAAQNENDVITNYAAWAGRARTTAYVPWSIPAWSLDAPVSTPDIKTVIQEAVNTKPFNGAFLIFFDVVDAMTTPGATRSAYSVEGNSTKAPVLEVTYEVTRVSFETRLTDSAEATQTYYLAGADIPSLSVAVAEDTGSGFGPFRPKLIAARDTSATALLCGSTYYYAGARYWADVSTNIQNVKWRVIVPAAKTAWKWSNNQCTTAGTTSVQNAVWAVAPPTLATQPSLGLGFWP